MENQFDFSKVIENLSAQIAAQAQQIAFLQALIQQMVPAETVEEPETESTADETA